MFQAEESARAKSRLRHWKKLNMARRTVQGRSGKGREIEAFEGVVGIWTSSQSGTKPSARHCYGRRVGFVRTENGWKDPDQNIYKAVSGI